MLSQGSTTKAPVSKNYSVTARSRMEGDKRVLAFIVTAISYKLAWEMARNMLRLGKVTGRVDGLGDDAKETFDEKTNQTEVEPGSWTVDKVFTTEKRSAKAEPLTARKFFEVAAERGITPSKKLLELLEELAPVEAAPEAEGEQPAGEGEQQKEQAAA